MRTIIPFNDDWLFAPRALNDFAPDADFTPVTLPHTNVLLPHHNFDNLAYQFISTYRKRFVLPEPLGDRRAYVDFDGAMMAASVAINGHALGEHDGGYTPFSYDITDYLRDGENLLTVQLDSTERPDIPPYGGVVDYLTFGGLYRDVALRLVKPCHITDVFVKPFDVASGNPRLEIDVTLRNQLTVDTRVIVSMFLDIAYDPRTTTEMYQGVRVKSTEIPAGGEATISVQYDVLPDLDLWTPANPQRHEVRVTAERENQAAPDDGVAVKFGVRDARFDEDGHFYLNGQPVKLFGLNRHQTYPFIGAAAPRRLQRRDADIIKYELGCNIVRTSHYPQSPHFIERCDEIGLLVFEEIPGWQHIGDSDWQALTLRDIEAMIKRDRNHPSIVLWGVRINESPDDPRFYTATNDLAHKLDPTRQTGGVRNFMDSKFLEDVFTFNDFSNTVQEPKHTPHLITEFNGHMYPTKTWDGEDRAIEHALRHARIQNLVQGNPRVAGGIGWCAFDYNTHREFGSGDRVCYHGVMDMFRLPKFAAHFYESQLDPALRPVLHAATYWTMGDRSEGGNNPLTIFSNCDEVEVIIGATSFGRFFPDREAFPHLPHPPFTVRGLDMTVTWGATFEDLTVVGYIGGAEVARQHYDASGLPHTLRLTVDDAQLRPDGADMTWLRVAVVDACGQRCPYAFTSVTFSLDGPADLIGTNPFPLAGGQAALFIKARHETGPVTVTATAPGLPSASVTLAIR